MKTLLQLNEELDAPIPRSAVSSRQGGGGRSLSYLAGHYVIDRLNKVFGPMNWASKTEMLKCVYEGEVNGKLCVSYIGQVRLVVECDGKTTEHTATGYGDGMDPSNPGKAHELAVKECETDALKRCAKNLGMSMGLALYSKDQENVVEDAPAGKPVQAAAPQPAVSEPAPARQSNPPATRPKFDRALLNREITATSKVILAMQKSTKDAIISDMKNKYGKDNKEELSDDQAEQFLRSLKELANAGKSA